MVGKEKSTERIRHLTNTWCEKTQNLSESVWFGREKKFFVLVLGLFSVEGKEEGKRASDFLRILQKYLLLETFKTFQDSLVK